MTLEDVIERRHVRSFRMSSLLWLFELLRISEQNYVARCASSRKCVRQCHLASFVNEEVVETPGGSIARP